MYGQIVLASTKSGLVPNAIKWFTDSQFSHSFVMMPDVFNIPMAIEAASSGVDMTRFDTGYRDNLNEGYEVWNIKINQHVKDMALKSILNDLEVGYGYLDFFYFVARKICKIFGKDIKNENNWFSKDGIICSQLCVAYLKACGLNIFSGYGNGSISPQDLQDIFNARPELFEKIESVRLT